MKRTFRKQNLGFQNENMIPRKQKGRSKNKKRVSRRAGTFKKQNVKNKVFSENKKWVIRTKGTFQKQK